MVVELEPTIMVNELQEGNKYMNELWLKAI